MHFGHPIFWIFVAAVVAPLLAEIPIGFRLPVVVLEVLLGIVIGPQVLGLVEFDGIVIPMFALGMGATLFMAGMELDFAAIKGRPLALGATGWILSILIGVIAVGILHVIPHVHAPAMVILALCTTGLGVLIPVFRDTGQLDTAFGRLMVAAGTVGEVGPIVAMSLFLSHRYSTWQEIGFLLVFLAIVAMAFAIGIGARPPRLLAYLNRQMHASSQLPVRIALLMLVGMFVLAEEFGFESLLGTFAAGMVVGQATRGNEGAPLRAKMDAITFGWFFPFFFVGTGIKFDFTALNDSMITMLMLPTFVALFLLLRGAPVVLYRHDIAPAHRLPFALAAAVPSLSIVVVIAEIGERTKLVHSSVSVALIGAALVSLLIFPTLSGILLARDAGRRGPG